MSHSCEKASRVTLSPRRRSEKASPKASALALSSDLTVAPTRTLTVFSAFASGTTSTDSESATETIRSTRKVLIPLEVWQ